MIQIIFVLFLLFNVVTLEGNVSNYENKGLIANGQIYDINKYPFVVCIIINIVLKFTTKRGFCTGSLISQWFVITAAHCTDNVTISNINVFSFLYSHLYTIKNSFMKSSVTITYRYSTVIVTDILSAYINTICIIR